MLRIGLAHGFVIDQPRGAELVGVVGAGFGLPAVARELLDLVPVAGWAVKGAVAYTGTRQSARPRAFRLCAARRRRTPHNGSPSGRVLGSPESDWR